MGLAGGPHCLVMCGAACAGITSAAPGARAMWGFQIGRLWGYSSLGALAAASMQGLGWLTLQSAAFRPLWSFFHVLLMLLGLWLVWRAEPPVWLGAWTQVIWRRIKPVGQRHAARAHFAAPLVLGFVWALCAEPAALGFAALAVRRRWFGHLGPCRGAFGGPGFGCQFGHGFVVGPGAQPGPMVCGAVSASA
jgi:hypothetical protein